MKKLKFIAMMLMSISLLGFNSCLGNDDDDYVPLTNAEKGMCYLQVQGNHYGDVIFATGGTSSSTTVNTDTLDCTFSIGRALKDTAYVYTLNIYDLPVRALAYNMSAGDCKEAMENAPDQDLECEIDFYSVSPVAWLINPITPEFTLTYGGQTHKIQVVFFVNSTYSIGAYGTVSSGSGTSSSSKKQIQMQILAAYIYVDGQQTSLLNSYTQFYFVADAI